MWVYNKRIFNLFIAQLNLTSSLAPSSLAINSHTKVSHYKQAYKTRTHSGTGRQTDRHTVGQASGAWAHVKTGTIQVICRLILSAFSAIAALGNVGSRRTAAGIIIEPADTLELTNKATKRLPSVRPV